MIACIRKAFLQKCHFGISCPEEFSFPSWHSCHLTFQSYTYTEGPIVPSQHTFQTVLFCERESHLVLKISIKQGLSMAYLHICLQLLHLRDMWIMRYGQVNQTSLRPTGHISRRYFICELLSLSVRRSEVGGRLSWMLRFHKHINRFLSPIQGIFYTLLAFQLQ